MATTVGTLLVNVIGNASGLKSTLSAAEGAVNKFGGGVARMGSRWTAGISLPIAGLLTGIAKVGIEFDDAMTKSLAIMGDVDNTMRARMTASAMTLSEKLRFSSKEIAAGYYDLASAGFEAGESLDNIGTVATFAQAGVMKMGAAGAYLAGAVKALGPELIGASDSAGAMARVADVLTSANNHALGSVEDFSQALTTRFASGMKQANMSLEEGVGFLMAYAEQNIKGKEASMQAWMALRDVQTKAITNAKAWDDLGVSVFDATGKLRPMPDILDQINLRMRGFSKGQLEDWLKTGAMPEIPDGPAMSAKAKRTFMIDLKLPDRSVSSIQKVLESSLSIREHTETLKNSLGEAERVAEKQGQSIAAKLEMAWHRVENAGIRVFENMKPIVVDFLNMFGDFMDKVDGWATKFNALDEPTRRWALQIMLAAVAFGPLMMIVGNFIQLAGAFMGVGKGMATMLGSIATHMLAVVNANTKMVQGRNALGQFTKAVPVPNAAPWAALTSAVSGFTGKITTSFAALAPWAGRLLAIVGLVDLFKPALKFLGTELYTAFSKLLAPLGGVETVFKRLSQHIVGGTGSWKDWVATAGAALRIMGGLWSMAQFGILQLAKLGVVIVTDVITNLIGLVQWVGHVMTSFGKWLGSIPYLGAALTWVWDKFSLGATQAWQIVSGVFVDFIRGLRSVGEAIVKYLPQEVQDVFGWVTNLGNDNRNLRETADAFDTWLAKMGMVDVKGKELTGTFEELKRAMPRSGKDAEFMGVRIPGAVGPPPPPPPTTPVRDPVKEAYDELMGDGGRKWRDVAKAVEEHKDKIYANADAMDRLWEIYKGVRETVGKNGLTKDLDGLFATKINFEEAEKFKGQYSQFFQDLFNNGDTQTELEKNLSYVQDYVRKMQATMAAIGDHPVGKGMTMFSPDFFNKYGDDIEKLNAHYASQSAEVKILIDEYYKWKNAMEAVERGGANITKSREVFGAITAAHADMTAKMKDKEQELANFRLSEDGKAIRGLSRNKEEQVREFQVANAAMMTSWKYLQGEELGEAVKKYLEMVKMQQNFIATMTLMDQERVAIAVGIDQRIIRSFRDMEESKRNEMIKTKAAANAYQRVMNELAEAFNKIAAVNDPKGNKWITWLGKISTLMGEAKQAGTDMKPSFSAMGDAFKAGDWGAFANGAMAAFKSVAEGYRIMVEATSSTNTKKAAMGGAVAGAQMGASGGGWSALIGGIAGAAFGFLRAGGNRAKETAKQFAEVQAKYKDMMNTFKANNPELKNVEGLMTAFGFSIGRLNTQADLDEASRQLERFGVALDALRGKFDSLFDRLLNTGVGIPEDIAAYIEELIQTGVISDALAAKFRAMQNEGTVSWEKMKEAADRYGLSEDKLGKAYNQSKLNSMAQQLIDDYDILTRGGADATDVLKAMAPKMSEMVRTALAMGITLPENLRDWIRKLDEAGLLVDENGNKIENLGDLKFGDALKTEWDKVTQALRDLIEELKKLPGLFGAIPTSTPSVPSPGGGSGGGAPGEETPGEADERRHGPSGAEMLNDTATRTAYNAGIAGMRTTSAVTAGASVADGGRGQTVYVLPVAVGDATSIEDLADLAISRLPEGIADNRGNIKYAIISAARATSVPKFRR